MTERERLIELIEQCSCPYSPPCTGECGECYNVEMYDRNIEHIADHLLSNGVIVPPCKVGDTVYCVENKSIHEGIVEYVKSLTYGNGTKFFVRVECEIEDPFYSDGRKMKHGIMAVWGIEWGSWHIAFPTIEEAEKALEERRTPTC